MKFFTKNQILKKEIFWGGGGGVKWKVGGLQ